MSQNKVDIQKLIDTVPGFDQVCNTESYFWVNQDKPGVEEANARSEFSIDDAIDAEKRLERFAPFIKLKFKDTEKLNGIIESPISRIALFQDYLEDFYEMNIPGRMYLKRDDSLPIAGTIKARGAIYEVLKHAEDLAIEHGLLKDFDDDYTKFVSKEFQDFFSQYGIVVGTTGNLGISSGVMGRTLGFNVTIHMSAEAKQWKKDYLRSFGINVVEHETNFTEAVRNGRAESDADPKSYFVDDEHSGELFFGYTVAGARMVKILEDMNIPVDEDHPLFVYLPCGIGGSPGGITFGLKQQYGDNVHCFFAEPTHMPSMLLGLLSKEFDGITVDDAGIDPHTVMDGLAVPRTSGFVSRTMEDYFDGGYTLSEEECMVHLTSMIDNENIALEPAALAGVPGPAKLFSTEAGQDYIQEKGLADKVNNITHISWATGGSMVPENDMEEFYRQGAELQKKHGFITH